MNLVDYNNRYRTKDVFYYSSNQEIRYGGLYNKVGSIFADEVNGVYNLKLGTTNKADTMIAQCNRSGWNVNATYTLVNGVVTVNAFVSAPKYTPCNMIVLLVDKTYHFKQCLGSYLGVGVNVYHLNTVPVVLSGAVAYTDFNVVVVFQSIVPYAVDGSQGNFERFVYGCNLAVKQ